MSAAQTQLGDVVRQLEVLRYLLLGIAASLPTVDETEAEDLGDVPTRIRADIECALADSIAPAIANLGRAARYPVTAAPTVAEPEES